MIFDVRTDDGLREALARVPTDGGWDGPVGRLIVAALRGKASELVNRQRSDVRDPHRVAHLVGHGWEYLATYTTSVAAAHSPWGMLHTAMRRHARAAELADELGVSEQTAKELTRSQRRIEAHTATRLGVDQPPMRRHEQADDPTGDAVTAETELEEPDDWDDALRLLRDQLVAAGAPPTQTDRAISGVLDVLSSVRRSHAHTAVYRSNRLEGLNHDQRRALVELLIGTRRGGPATSAWLSLRRAPDRGELPWASIDPAAAARMARFVSPFRRHARPEQQRALALSA